MGYTHYFTQQRHATPDEWAKIVDLFGKIVEASDVPLLRDYDEPDTRPDVTSNHIWFNGVDEDGHETMVLRREHEGFAFCKTARKPYDEIVGALLAVAAHVASGVWEIGSDGDEEEWQAALKLAREAAGETIAYPVVRDMTTAVEHRYVVRVALDEEQIEDIRIKGTVDFMAHAELIRVHDNTETPLLFDIRPPAHVEDEDTKAWAEKVAEGMTANHYNAVVAPPWPEQA